MRIKCNIYEICFNKLKDKLIEPEEVEVIRLIELVRDNTWNSTPWGICIAKRR